MSARARMERAWPWWVLCAAYIAELGFIGWLVANLVHCGATP